MEPDRNATTDVHDALERATALLHRHDALVDLAVDAAGETGAPSPTPTELAQRQAVLEELRAMLDPLHPADVAYILEALPLAQQIGRAHV